MYRRRYPRPPGATGPAERIAAMSERSRASTSRRVTAWFEAQRAGRARRRSRFELIAGGHSNLTYRVTDAAGHRFVLRRPPLGHVLATAHDMGREHKIISALGPTDVPGGAGARPLHRRGGERRAVLRHGLRRRARAPRRSAPPTSITAEARAQRQPLDRRHPGQDPRRRPRRRRPRRPRQEGGLHPAPAQALVRPVGEVEDPRAARWSTRSTTRCSPRSPSRARRRSSTATTGSTTA